jgi:hypothetical protein
MADVGLWAMIPATITAGASLVVALISLRKTRQASHELAALTHTLEEQRAESQARRDYVYEARKRVYAECEPLLFQGLELADNARRRVRSLARSCRTGDLLPDGSGWLAREDYYLHSTIYTLLAPLTTYKILQRKLTRVDLGLEPNLRWQYELVRAAFDTFTDDHKLASIEPRLDYDPESDRGKLGNVMNSTGAPDVYRKQGYYWGTLDQIVEAMIVAEGGVQRCKSFGEFLIDLQRSDSATGALQAQIRSLLLHFHPVRAPILWRLAIAQFFLYGYLITNVESAEHLIRFRPSVEDFDSLNWGGADESVPRSQVEAGYKYATQKVEEIRARL